MHREKQIEHFTDLKRTIDSLGGVAKVYERLDLSMLYLSLHRLCNKDKEDIKLYGELPIDNYCQKSLFIPNGIERIGIPSNSYIEFKPRLISDTIYKEYIFARKYKEIYPNAKITLVYKECDISQELLEQAKGTNFIDIIEYNEFIHKISPHRVLEGL